MEQTVKVIYFSPTGTTEKILGGVVEGLNFKTVNYLNLTERKNREKRREKECIVCMACVKKCPDNARISGPKNNLIKYGLKRMNSNPQDSRFTVY